MTERPFHESARVALFWFSAVVALGIAACDSSPFSAGPPATCVEAGVQCVLPSGPLGVCERSPCPASASSPCFQCVPQH